MEQNKQLIASMITAIFAIGLMTIATNVRAADDQQVMEKCFGVVKAGQNDCDTNDGQCAPSLIDASPNEWIYLPKGVCDRLVGGMSAPPAPTGNSPTTNSNMTKAAPAAQPGNSAPNAPPGSGSTGGFDDGMNAPNTPYVNDY